MIIGLAGQKGSGKDTVAAYLVKRHGFERRAFADSLKKSVEKLFDISYADIEKFKNDDSIKVVIEHTAMPHRHISDMSFRQFLQRYGTESHREVFGDDFWLEHCIPLSGFYTGRNIVITDLRFYNEARRVQFFNGFVVRVSRGEVLDETLHRSEDINALMDAGIIDHTIYNDGSIEDLSTEVERMLSAVCEGSVLQ
jgi:dephospho-CoA kinase